MEDHEDEDGGAEGAEQPGNQKKKKPKRNLKRKQKKAERTDKKNDKDYERFLQDLEDDPEYRQNVKLYKDDDAIAELEAGMGSLSLNQNEKSEFGKAMKEGVAKIQGEERVVKQAARKTEAGKNKRDATDKARLRS